MSDAYPVNVLGATRDVSPSGYHAWAQRTPSLRAQANAALLPLIAEAYRTSRQTYGSPRITHWLRAHGQPCGRVRVARLMRQAGVNRRPRRRFRPLSLTDSHHALPVAPNRLLEKAQPVRPNAVWVADITYVETQEGFLYVAGILDRGRRRCISAGRWVIRWPPPCRWPRWTWHSRNAARPAGCSITPTRASNMPAATIGSGWRRLEPCRA